MTVARAILGWSQVELTREANVARQAIADFERGARTVGFDSDIGNARKSVDAAIVDVVMRLKRGAGKLELPDVPVAKNVADTSKRMRIVVRERTETLA